MLTYLHVKNFALIKTLEINFKEGLTILSGETGAGKSIIIGSMNAISGGKLDKGIIRKGSDYALIEMIFVMDEGFLQHLKDTYDIPYDEHHELIVSRRYNDTGRSVYRVNNQTVTAQVINEIAEQTIDIHSQHEHQSLLNPSHHIELLDQYLGDQIKDIKSELSGKYTKYRSFMKQIQQDHLDDEGRRREMDFLGFEINEIESANLIPGEDELLARDYKVLSNKKRIVQNLVGVESLLNSNPEGNISELISHVIGDLDHIRHLDDVLDDMAVQAEQVDSLLTDLIRTLEGYLENLEGEEYNVDTIEDRIHLLNTLKQKYGNSIEEILESLNLKIEKLEYLQNYDENIEKIKAEISQYEKDILVNCKVLSQFRQKAAGEISIAIENILGELNFTEAKVEVSVEPLERFTGNGNDLVTFLISTNKNEPVQPLNKIASGGELSRVMLAIKSVFADMDQIGTLVFDEIDNGISGRTAQKVGEKMAAIARHRQIICITHLPQISAMADQHFLIEKLEQNERIETFVRKLDNDEVSLELARLIGGAQITDNTIQTAEEMKQQANAIKKKM